MKEFIEKLFCRLEEEIIYDPFDYYKEEPLINMSFESFEKIVNQFAEEYNNDFCEWHKVKNGNAYKCNTHAEIHDSRVLDWCICPYCGKKIKVVE